jgi:protein required for attachment to host cells
VTRKQSDAAVWVLAADRVRARLFRAERPVDPLEEMDDLVNPDARSAERELVSDAPGSQDVMRGVAHHALDPQKTEKDHSVEVFARQVAGRLAKLRTEGEMKRVYILANPEFLGMLRNSLDVRTRRLVAAAIPKSVTRLRPEEIRASLPRQL